MSLLALGAERIGRTGNMKPSRAKSVIARWRRLAGAALRLPRKPMTEEQWRGRIAMSGIKLETVP